MYKALSPGAVGMKVNGLQETIDLTKSAGFEGVEVSISDVASLIEAGGKNMVKDMFADSGIRPAGWGMPVDWRGDESAWRKGLEELPRLASAAKDISCFRTMTWIMPCSNDRPYDENRRFHVERMKPISEI